MCLRTWTLGEEVFLKRKAARHTLLTGALKPQCRFISHGITTLSLSQVCYFKGGAGFDDVLET